MMIDPIRQYLQSYGVEAPLKEVTVQPLPVYLRHLGVSVSGGHSFQTVAETIFNLEVDGCKNLAYVLGYGFHGLPLEQAVIQAGEYYYDPIQRLKSGSQFGVVWALSAGELTEFVATNNRPPEFFDWLQWQSHCLKKNPVWGFKGGGS